MFGFKLRLGLGVSLVTSMWGLAEPRWAGAQELAQEPAPAEAQGAEEDAAESGPPPAINLTGAPSMDLTTPAPGPAVGRTYHQHDGFYLRANAGLGTLLHAAVDAGTAGFDSGGLTLNFDLLLGGSPAPGFSLGAGVLGGLQMSGDWEAEGGGGSSSGDLTTLIVGPFVDGFPDAKKGWHFGGMAGLARVAFELPGSPDGDDAFGIGGAFWAGHDVWVAPEWSVGGLLRLDALRASENDVTTTAVGLTVMFSVLYN